MKPAPERVHTGGNKKMTQNTVVSPDARHAAQAADLLVTVASSLNERLEVLSIVLTMEDRRNRLSMQVIDEVRKHFPKLVARTRIPRTVRLAEAPSHGKPISVYDPSSRAAKAYADLAREVEQRLRAREPIALAGSA